jgi:hypothetical protein
MSGTQAGIPSIHTGIILQNTIPIGSQAKVQFGKTINGGATIASVCL